MTTELTRPPGLRDFLDQGGDLTAIDGPVVWLEGLVEDLYLHYMLVPPSERQRLAAQERASAESLLAHGNDATWLPVFTDPERNVRTTSDLQRLITFYSWTAELCEDEELRERFKAAVPRILIERYESQLTYCRDCISMVAEAFKVKVKV